MLYTNTTSTPITASEKQFTCFLNTSLTLCITFLRIHPKATIQDYSLKILILGSFRTVQCPRF